MMFKGHGLATATATGEVKWTRGRSQQQNQKIKPGNYTWHHHLTRMIVDFMCLFHPGHSRPNVRIHDTTLIQLEITWRQLNSPHEIHTITAGYIAM